MKRFLTLAMMVLLLGGFALNANAQKGLKVNNKKKGSVTFNQSQIKGNNLEGLLKSFETAVEKCLVAYNSLQSSDNPANADPKEFNKLLSQAESARETIEAAKANLNRSQTSRFNAACKKLLTVYQKF